MSVIKKISTLCLGVGLALSMSSVTFAAEREPSRTELPEVCCEPDPCSVTCFTGHVAVDPCRKLLANFIDPVWINPRTEKCEPLDTEDAATCFSGNIGVRSDRSLWVNRICAVMETTPDCDEICPDGLNGCIDDPEGCVVIKNPVFEGKVCFDGDVGTFGDCTNNKNGILTNFIWPVLEDLRNKPSCKRDDQCGVTCFQGNAAMNPCRQFRTNYIVPVQDNTHKNDSEICCDEFDCGTATFQGNAGMDECCMFLTNFICPTTNVNDPNCNYEPWGNKDKSSPNVTGITNFSGDIGLDCRRKLLVNRIDPVKSTRKNSLECDREGFCFLEAEIDYDDDAITCFSGNVGIDDGKCLLVNRIGPVKPTDTEQPGDEHCPTPGRELRCKPLCEFDENGCLELHGAKVIIPNTLLVNELCPYQPFPCARGEEEMAVMNLRSNVNIDRSLEVAGDLILDGHNIGDVVQELQKAYAQVQVELAQLRSILNN